MPALQSRSAIDSFTAHNKFVDAHTEHDTELHKLRLKIADLEDHSRRNNVTFCGILESVTAEALVPYAIAH